MELRRHLIVGPRRTWGPLARPSLPCLSPWRGTPHSPPPSLRVPTAPGTQVRLGPGRLGAGPPGTALRAYGPAGAPGGPAPPLLTLLPDRVTRGPGNSQAGTSEAGTQGSLDTTGQLTAACEAHDPGSATFQGFGHPGLEVGTGAVGSGRARGRCQALPGGPPHQVAGFCPSPGLGQPPSRSTEVGSCGA